MRHRGPVRVRVLRPHLSPIGVVGVVVGLMLGASCDSGGAQQRPSKDDEVLNEVARGPDLLGEFEITVVSSQGETRSATLRCGGGNSGTGYLAGEPAHWACVTAVATPDAMHYLETGERPDKCPGPVTDRGWRASVKGRTLVNPTRKYVDVSRQITVETACDQATWTLLLPMFEPTTKEPFADDPRLDGNPHT